MQLLIQLLDHCLQRTVPLAIEGSFDFFKILPADPSSLSTYQLESLLSLLLECIQQAPGGTITARAPKFMYKHLQRIINILISSHVKGIQEQAYVLARAAMISSGAFEQNFSEVDAWLFSLTGYCMKSYTADSKGAGTTHDLPVVISSFLSDAVSTIGNNLFKYLDQMRELISRLENVNGTLCFIYRKCYYLNPFILPIQHHLLLLLFDI